MKKNYGLYFFAGGLLLITIQFMAFIFGYINSDHYTVDQIFYVAKDQSIGDFISQYWCGLIGTVLLIVLFVRRLTRGPEAMMVLVGVLLWIIQILSIYDSSIALNTFIVKYILGIVGVVAVAIAGFCEAYIIKSQENNPSDNKNNGEE